MDGAGIPSVTGCEVRKRFAMLSMPRVGTAYFSGRLSATVAPAPMMFSQNVLDAKMFLAM